MLNYINTKNFSNYINTLLLTYSPNTLLGTQFLALVYFLFLIGLFELMFPLRNLLLALFFRTIKNIQIIPWMRKAHAINSLLLTEINQKIYQLNHGFLITVNAQKAFVGPLFFANSNKRCESNNRYFGTIQQGNSVNENPPKEKKTSSWRLWFTLRLMVLFGLLIFLFFSYLLSESFDFEKVYKQISVLLNDPQKLQNFIWRCWTKYIHIWDFRQWIVSVGAIIPGYWYLFNVLYSIGLLDKKFTPSQKIFFIATDLFLNFVVGLVYMAYPRTVIGALMCQCPVALSPYFIIIEIIIFILYRTWLKYQAKIKQ